MQCVIESKCNVLLKVNAWESHKGRGCLCLDVIAS